MLKGSQRAGEARARANLNNYNSAWRDTTQTVPMQDNATLRFVSVFCHDVMAGYGLLVFFALAVGGVGGRG